MTVPRLWQLYAGVPVNIILKADQRTGKLTSGKIADLLTHSDHTRGIKVRLEDGRIGRVQSILTPSSEAVSTEKDIYDPSNGFSGSNEATFRLVPSASRARRNSSPRGRKTRNFSMQEDYRNDPTPAETRSLEDYIKKPTQKKKGKKNAKGSALASSQSNPEAESQSSTQQDLEKEFSQLDSALIAAIMAEHPGDLDETRRILGLLGRE